MKKLKPRTLAQFAILTALEIVLSRFLSISAWSHKIGFSFVPVALAAMLYGPLPAGVIAALADFIGAILFPSGPFFPGFTLTAFLGGVTYGLAFGKKQTAIRILAAVLVREFALSLVLNSLWISILYSSPFWPLLVSRFIQCAVMTPVQFVVILLVAKTLPHRLLRGAAT